MSLTYVEMKALRNEIEPILLGSSFESCLVTTEWHIIIAFKTLHGTKKKLLICLKEPFLRFHLTEASPKETLNSHFSNSLNALLKHAILKEIDLVNNDRILKLSFEKKSRTYNFIAQLFSRGANAFILEGDSILDSFRPLEEAHFSIDKRPSHLTPISHPEHISSFPVEQHYQRIESQATFEKEKIDLHKEIRSRLKKVERQKTNAIQDLKECSNWEKVYHEAVLLKSSFHLLKKGMKDISIPDWQADLVARTISLDPHLPPSEEIKKRFSKSKKLRAGIPHAEERITKYETEEMLYKSCLERIKNSHSLEELIPLKEQLGLLKKTKNANIPAAKEALPYREYTTQKGLKVLVGKNAKNNEALTFRYAKGSDWWLHVQDYPGSHVILKVNKNQEPDQKSLQDAIQLAIHFSKAKDKGTAEICISQCKHVSRLGKRTPGKVQVSKSRKLIAKYDPEIIKRLKSFQS